MMHAWLKGTVAALLLAGADYAVAQTAADAVDSTMPPAGYVAPKPAAERDLSMATYAKDSFLDGEEGVVGLRILVRKDGSIGETQVATSSGTPRLDKYAQDTVKEWRYVPATVNGAPVDTWIPVNVIWALETLRFEVSRVQNLPNYYPQASIRASETGKASVRFLVGSDGKVTKAVIDKSSGHPRLDDAALTLVKSGLNFTPAMLKPGGNVAGWYRWTLSFNIDGIKAKDDGTCFAPLETVDPDAVIANCTEFLQAASITPYQRATALLARGNARSLKKDYAPGIEDFDAGIRASPGIADLFTGRARANLARGARGAAFADFDSAIQVEPQNHLVYLARARAYFDAGQLDKSLADFQGAMRLSFGGWSLLASRCYFLAYIGRPQDGLSDCEKALPIAEKVASSFRESESALAVRGYAYFKLGQYRRAIQDYDAALKRNERLAAVLYARGVAKLKMGDAAGEVDITAAKAINPYIANMAAEDGIAP